MDRIRVGTFELDPPQRMLSLQGKPLELGARAFDLLLVLVEQPGRLVTKATLLERVWPRVIVDENNLPAQIASLRRVLGAGAIRTIPGFGYRLELAVAAADAGPPPIARGADPAPAFTVPSHAWPSRLGPLIGRDDEVRELEAALTRSNLVTIVGIPGVGKTRLAQEILLRESGRAGCSVAWASLGPVADIQLVPSTIAVALGLSLPDGVDGFTALRQSLEQAPLLLILDCAERLGNALAGELSDLIAHTQAVRVLVTSQAPLGVSGETVYRLTVLPVPPVAAGRAELERYAAVSFFAQRAGAADRRFELSASNAALVAEVCRRLDGIPLALELAAARVPALGLATLLERLDDRFRVLRQTARTTDPRHSALHAAFDWSYGLLSPPEQRVFNRLGTFAGSFALKAAARCVADDQIDTADAIDLIGRLVDRSLVTMLAVDPPRYTLLETARFYALERLAADEELDHARERMAAAMLELLDVAYQEYWSVDEVIWLHRYEAELDNVRIALDWAIEHDSALGIALFGSAWPLFFEMDLYAEGRARYARALPLLTEAIPRTRVARFWEAIATYDSTRQCDRARYAAELATKMYADANEARSHYYGLMLLAFNWRVDAATARAAFDQARRLEDPAWPARLLAYGGLTEGALLLGTGDFAGARAAYQRAVRLALTTSERQALAATVHLVELDIVCDELAAALQIGRPMSISLRYLGRLETRFEVLALTFAALLIRGEVAEASPLGIELYELALRLDTSKLYSALDAMALFACRQQRYQVAARILACADHAHESHGQLARRPVEQRLRAIVVDALVQNLGADWRDGVAAIQPRLDEQSACSLALELHR